MNQQIKKLFDIALGEIGTQEYPPNSNLQKYGEWYNLNGQPWCAIFVSWCFNQAGIPLVLQDSKGYYNVPKGYSLLKQQDKIVDKPQPGDLIFFDFNGDGIPEHTGIVNEVHNDNTFLSIEGNTSTSSEDNGGAVMKRKRYVSQCLGFGRVIEGYDYINHKYEHAILSVKQKGIMIGDPDGNFRPDDPITRGEFAVIIDYVYKKLSE